MIDLWIIEKLKEKSEEQEIQLPLYAPVFDESPVKYEEKDQKEEDKENRGVIVIEL